MHKRILATLLVMALAGCGGVGDEQNTSSSSSSSSGGNGSSSSSSSSSGSVTGSFERWNYILGINVGGDAYTADNGLAFEADAYFTGGTTQVITDTISGTNQQPIFQSERWGDVTYELPVGSGHFQVVLKFAELFQDASNARLISVDVEGQSAAQNLDLFAQAGKFGAHEIKLSSVTVNDGYLTITTSASVDNGTLSGIEVYADKDNPADFSDSAIMDGEGIYNAQCSLCHDTSGDGNGVFPSLLKSDCVTCASAPVLINKIAEDMPVDGSCTGDCAINVAGFILANFNDEPVNPADCRVKSAPIRRLTRFEYSNTVDDLLGDDTRPGNALPSEEIGNGFGNDALSMSVSSLLAEQYGKVAEEIANRTVNNNSTWQQLHSCVQNVNGSTETSCANQIIDRLLPRAFRRAVTNSESQAYKNLYNELASFNDFKTSVAGVIEAVLQSPEFLYRAEVGKMVDGRLKPTDYEMASRLSYFFWGSMPDDTLMQAAAQGRLTSAQDVRAQAERMLEDPRARNMIRYFFDAYLPISGLSHLERDSVEFPTFNALIGNLMHQETQNFLEHVIFEGAGDWGTALTADYTFMNQTLANFYGVNGVSGDHFRQVPLDTNLRKGLLTQGGIMAGTTHSGKTNPVVRGAYVMKKLLCVAIPLPSADLAAEITPPDPTSGLTGRDRFSAHSQNEVCQTCHDKMDPVGLVFENYDPIGLYRTHENGVLIDAHGGLPGTDIQVNDAIELVEAIADDPRTHQCFAYNWANFAYGKTIGASENCIKDTITMKFSESGNNIKSLLVELTQTDAFLYLPADHLQ